MTEQWEETKETVTERTAYLLETGDLSDVEFLVGSEENVKTISAHKFILSMGSPVFEAMFRSQKDSKPIKVPDITPKTFTKILRYLYTDDLYLEDIDEVLEMHYAAEKYFIRKLKIECNNHFQSIQLLPDNLCNVVERANIFSAQCLKKQCVHYLSAFTTDVLKSSGFRNAKQETVKMILQMDEVSVHSEVEFFEALLDWGRAECGRKNLEENSANIRTVAEPLLPCIRFLTMSFEEFTHAMNNSENMFGCEETLEIYMKIASLRSEPLKSLPIWCNDSPSKRIISSDILWTSNRYSFQFVPATSVVKYSITSNICLESFNDNLVIKGLNFYWVYNRENDISGTERTQHYFVVEVINPTTNQKVIMKSTLTVRSDVNFVLPTFIYVAPNEKVDIKIHIDTGIYKTCVEAIEMEHRGEDFGITFSAEALNFCYLIVKNLIYFKSWKKIRRF